MAFQPYQNYSNSNQFYLQNLQDMRDRIDNQLRNYQQAQMQQPVAQPITQNFQLAPQTNSNDLEGRFADNIDTVKNTFVSKTGIFITKDFSTLWIKDVSGNIRTFKIDEVVEIDPKDKEINELKREIEKMKGMIANEYGNTDVDEPVTTKKSTRISNNTKSNEK